MDIYHAVLSARFLIYTPNRWHMLGTHCQSFAR